MMVLFIFKKSKTPLVMLHKVLNNCFGYYQVDLTPLNMTPLNTTTSKEKRIIKQKIKNILNDARRKQKGEEHSLGCKR